MAGQIGANSDLDPWKRLGAKVRIEGDEPVQMIEGNALPL
jgi:hypothetical protein